MYTLSCLLKKVNKQLNLIESQNAICNSLPNNKILDWSKFKFKAFADDKICVTQILKFVLRRAKNIVGKGENAFQKT